MTWCFLSQQQEKIRFELEHNTQLIVDYKPKIYEGAVLLIKASQLPDSSLPIYQDPYNGWHSLIHPQNLRHTVVAKTHSVLLNKDHVESVANIITECLIGLALSPNKKGAKIAQAIL